MLVNPTHRPRPARQSFHGSRLTFGINKDLTQKLRDLSRREGVTLFMTLLAALADIAGSLQRAGECGGNTDGESDARGDGRVDRVLCEHAGVAKRMKAEPSFRELLQRVREGAGAYAHQDVPFEKLVEELQPERI